MTMTAEDLLDHAGRLQAELDHKRRQIRDGSHTTTARAGLLAQINALAARVDELTAQCAVYAAPVLALPADTSAA